VDGCRVDAVAAMIYRSYGRESEEWVPNVYGGDENIEAQTFLQNFNGLVHEKFLGKSPRSRPAMRESLVPLTLED
jgi:1,4-alpha-glucan branching enzyme